MIFIRIIIKSNFPSPFFFFYFLINSNSSGVCLTSANRVYLFVRPWEEILHFISQCQRNGDSLSITLFSLGSPWMSSKPVGKLFLLYIYIIIIIFLGRWSSSSSSWFFSLRNDGRSEGQTEIGWLPLLLLLPPAPSLIPIIPINIDDCRWWLELLCLISSPISRKRIKEFFDLTSSNSFILFALPLSTSENILETRIFNK